jgi:hypothetical protein
MYLYEDNKRFFGKLQNIIRVVRFIELNKFTRNKTGFYLQELTKRS